MGRIWIYNFSAFCKQQWSDFSYKLPEGEALEEVQQRNIRALKLVLEKYRDRNIEMFDVFAKTTGCEVTLLGERITYSIRCWKRSAGI